MAKQRIGVAHHGDIWVSPCGKMELRCGSWEEVLADVDGVDALITDPPYGHRTHAGQRYRLRGEQNSNNKLNACGLEYEHWTPEIVDRFVYSWSQRTRGWMACMTSHDLITTYEDAYSSAGRYQFAPLSCIVPIACVQNGMNIRLAGDGPSNWTVHLMVARPRTREYSTWGTLRGAYHGPPIDAGENRLDRSKRAVAGGKPLWLMRSIVSDYTRTGDLVCDPCAGGGTTLLAAAMEGRRAIGAELDPETFTKAVRRLQGGYTQSLFV